MCIITPMTINHQAPIKIRPESALGKYIPPCCNNAP